MAGDGVVALEMSGVRKRFSRSGQWVLDGIDLAAAAGTLTVITGGNGSGKSTLLRIAAGATLPTSGRISRPPRPAAYVPERLPARLRMTASQYLAHMGRIRGLALAAVTERATEVLARLALEPGLDVPIGILSRGNCQKVALAQALLAPVRLMVLDEPYGGLDEQALAQAAALVDQARAEGTIILLAAPDLDVPNLADATYRLADRRLSRCLADSTPAPGTGGQAGDAGDAGTDSKTPVTRLALVAVSPRLSADKLAATPGVLSADHDAAAGRLVVRCSDADALLRRALGSGWSFLDGRREGRADDGQIG